MEPCQFHHVSYSVVQAKMRSDVVLDTQRYLVFAGFTVYSVYFILQLFTHDSKAFLKFWENVNQYCKVGVPFMWGYFNLPMPYRKSLIPFSLLIFQLYHTSHLLSTDFLKKQNKIFWACFLWSSARLVFPLSPTHHDHPHQTAFPIPCLKERRRKQKNKGNQK